MAAALDHFYIFGNEHDMLDARDELKLRRLPSSPFSYTR